MFRLDMIKKKKNKILMYLLGLTATYTHSNGSSDFYNGNS